VAWFALLCSLTPPPSSPSFSRTLLQWIVECEQQGRRVLRWLLAFHYDVLLETFVSLSYGTAAAAAAPLFSHAVIDQFVRLTEGDIPPSSGIWADQCVACVCFVSPLTAPRQVRL
jgi:hypothetical protein